MNLGQNFLASFIIVLCGLGLWFVVMLLKQQKNWTTRALVLVLLLAVMSIVTLIVYGLAQVLGA